MKLPTKVAGATTTTLIALFTAGISSAASIPVTNAGFEGLSLSYPSDYTLDNIPGWSHQGLCSTFWPTITQGGDFPQGIPEGLQVAAVSGGASISQTLTTVLAADTQYTLLVGIGNRAGFYSGGYTVSLSAGGTVLATDSSQTPGAGLFATSTISYHSPSTGAAIGSALAITLYATGPGEQAEFDDVRLFTGTSGAATPEPGTWVLLAAGAGGLVPWLYRKRRFNA